MNQVVNIAKHLKGFRHHKGLIYKFPYNDILSGFYLEKVKSNYYLWKFSMPIYVPTETINFTFSYRLSKDDGTHIFDFSDATTIDKIIKIIVNEEGSLITDIKSFYDFFYKKENTNIHIQEALAYSLLFFDSSKAIGMLENLIEELGIDKNIMPWEQDILKRAKNLAEEISIGNGLKKLEEYKQISIKNIGIDACPVLSVGNSK